jgi:DNA-binding IclR family transcriptional regulator
MSELPSEDLTDEERAVLNEVVKAGEKGVLPEDIAKKLKMPVDKIIEILEHFEEEGWFYSEEED